MQPLLKWARAKRRRMLAMQVSAGTRRASVLKVLDDAVKALDSKPQVPLPEAYVLRPRLLGRPSFPPLPQVVVFPPI